MGTALSLVAILLAVPALFLSLYAVVCVKSWEYHREMEMVDPTPTKVIERSFIDDDAIAEKPEFPENIEDSNL